MALGFHIDAYNRGRFVSQRRYETSAERPLLDADQAYIWQQKAPFVLYGLRELIGQDAVDAALLEFHQDYAFRSQPPFAGSDDLYRVLQRHVPDSFRNYLEDTWEKTCFYHNELLEANAVPTGKNDEYIVTLRVSVGKFYVDSLGVSHPVNPANGAVAANDPANGANAANDMNDYIDIGIFAAEDRKDRGRAPSNPLSHPLWMQRQRFDAGVHIIVATVHGRPANARIDPDHLLLDDKPWDHQKEVGIK